jgi:CBS domain-containing protein
MTEQTAQSIPLETQLPQASTIAMQTFCEDINGMLGISIGCALCQAGAASPDKLKPFFQKLAAVYSVQSEGVLSGRFDLIIDKTALFLLAGLFVLLPEDKIKEQCKQGTLEAAVKLTDTVKEIGNLIVGAWDRVYREHLPGHKHLLQTNTQITNPWEKPAEVFPIPADGLCLLTVWEMTVGDYPPFHAAAIFPAALFEPPKEEPQADQPQPTPDQPQEQPADQSAQTQPAAQDTQPAPQDTQPAPSQTADAPQTNTADQQPVWNAIQQLVHSQPAAAPLDVAILNCPAQIIMNTKPLWLSPNDSVETALQRMQQNAARYALIEEKDQMVGILSQSDLNAAISPYLRTPFEEYRRPLDDASLQIRIKWFMSRPVRTITPDTPLWKVMDTMYRYQIRALPVQDAAGSVIGLITVMEIFHALLQPTAAAPTADTQSQKTD